MATLAPDVPYRLKRAGILMRRDPVAAWEREGVLNPASAVTEDGRLWLLPRLVAEGNVSRIGLAEVEVVEGSPTRVARRGVVLSPDAQWERSHDHAGVEDPRVTWIASLGAYVMSYVAFGPLGPRAALAISTDVHEWRRLGPVHFEFEAELDIDLNLVANKDVVLFPEPVPGPGGRPCYALLHRPMWDMRDLIGGEHIALPAGLEDPRPGIWISYSPADDVERDVANLAHVRAHQLVALPAHEFESVKIGAGTPPVRVPEGWLVFHHGVSGELALGWEPQRDARYCAGAILLDPGEPSRVLARSRKPLLEPELPEEVEGIVPNVVFPTASEQIGGRRYIFYGMADSAIGAASLEHC